MQEICDTAREIVAHVREGMPIRQAVEIAINHPSSFSIPKEYTAGYGMQTPTQGAEDGVSSETLQDLIIQDDIGDDDIGDDAF